jgi:class 3 adenylate cyclase
MPVPTDTLAPYVPALVARRYARDPAPLTAQVAERFPAAVLFADISGFTPLTARLAQRGPAGVEELARILNDYFGRLIELITDHGGDIVKFAGDALLAVWPAAEEDLAAATRRAAQAALAVQAALHAYTPPRAGAGPAGDAAPRLALKVSIGAGEVTAMHVGGAPGRWWFLLAGAPLAQMAHAEHDARPGDVVLSPEAWALVRGDCAGTPCHATDVPEVHGAEPPWANVRLEGLLTPPPPRPLRRPVPDARAEAALHGYLPGAVGARLAAGLSEWLAELRRVTVIFLHLPAIEQASPAVTDELQRVMDTLAPALDRYEATVKELTVDDKGTVLIAVFGLPPLAHEDDAARGVQAALAMAEALTAAGVPCAMGVTTGRAFCGTVGSDRRREYTVIGDVMNMAARLMMAATEGILCDAATEQAARARVAFTPLPPIRVKGKDEPMPVYRPRAVAAGERDGGALRPLVGRTEELAALDAVLAGLRAGGTGLVVIEAEAGMGKSRLVAELLARADAIGATALVGVGDAIERASAYHAWRPVFERLLNPDGIADADALRAHVLGRLAGTPDLLRLAPLLNAVLPLGLPDNETTAQLSGQVRADNTHELLVRLLMQAAAPTPGPRAGEGEEAGTGGGGLLLVLEDAHWIDSASWALARVVGARVRPLLLVIATRPIAEPVPAEYRQFVAAPDTVHLRLQALAPAETVALVCGRLGVASLPAAVETLIRTRAEGNPFFSEELAYALRDAGLLRVENGECRLAPEAGDLRALRFPDTLEGVITSRIDRLTPSQQLAVKVASVIGRVFSFALLRDVYPLPPDRDRLLDDLRTLDQADLTPLESPEPELTYVFKHAIIQEVAYGLMLFAQRRELHRAVAQWYERAHADDLAPLYPLLAHHWSRAEDAAKTIAYASKAGEQALRRGASQEAVIFLEQVLALDARVGEGTGADDRLRRARWERQLGEAHLNLANVAESREHLERALTLLGSPAPASRPRLAAGLVVETARQAWHRLRPGGRRGRPASREDEAAIEAARAYERLGESYYLATEIGLGINACLRTLNLAERGGLSPELARAYANTSLAAGVLPLRPLAEMYGRRALATAERLGDLPALVWALEVNALYRIGTGEWGRARDAAAEAAEIADRLGDRVRWQQNTSLLSEVAYYQGEFARSAELAVAVYASARAAGNAQQEVVGLFSQARSLLPRGRLDEAVALLERAAALLGNVGRSEEITTHGLRAAAYLRRGDHARARRAAETALDLIRRTPPLGMYALEGYAGTAEVFLTLWEAGPERPAMARRAHRACAALRGFARVFPIGRPRAALWTGRALWLAGAHARARAAWERALAVAERLGMPYEQGRAHDEIARHLPAGTPLRRSHTARAAAIFARLGAEYDRRHAEGASTVNGG